MTAPVSLQPHQHVILCVFLKLTLGIVFSYSDLIWISLRNGEHFSMCFFVFSINSGKYLFKSFAYFKFGCCLFILDILTHGLQFTMCKTLTRVSSLTDAIVVLSYAM